MKWFIRISMIAMLFPCMANAGSGSGKVVEVMIHDSSDGAVLMFRTENNSDKAQCSTNVQAWAVTLESNFGRAILSQILAAKSQNVDIYVKGADDCNDWFDRERPIYVYII